MGIAKTKRTKKFIKPAFIFRFIIVIILLALVTFSLLQNFAKPSITNFFNGNMEVVNDDNMYGEFEKNSLVFYKSKNINKIESNSIIVYKTADLGIQFSYYLGKFKDAEKNEYITLSNFKGIEKVYMISEIEILGEKTKAIGGLGYVYNLICNQYFILAIVILIFILMLYPILFIRKEKNIGHLLYRQKKYSKAKTKYDLSHQNMYYTIQKDNADNKYLFNPPTNCKMCIAKKKKTKDIICAIFLSILIILSIISTTFDAIGYKKINIKNIDGSTISVKNGDLCYYKDIGNSAIKIGDRVIVSKINSEGKIEQSIKRFAGIRIVEDKLYYSLNSEISGDAVTTEYTKEEIVGLFSIKLSGVGSFDEIIFSDIAFIIFCILIALVLYYWLLISMNTIKSENKFNNFIKNKKSKKNYSLKKLNESELNKVKVKLFASKSTKNSHIILIGTIALLVIVTFILLTYSVTTKSNFSVITASNSVLEKGDLVISNGKNAPHLGDLIILHDTSDNSKNITSKYIVEIDGEKFILGSTTKEVSYVNGEPLTCFINDIIGVSSLNIPKFQIIINKMLSIEFKIAYIILSIIILAIIVAFIVLKTKTTKVKNKLDVNITGAIIQESKASNKKQIKRTMLKTEIEAIEKLNSNLLHLNK